MHSHDTEILTNHGWKYIKDIDTNNDLIMSLNDQTLRAEMISAVQIKEQYINEYMYLINKKNINVLVTKDHIMYISSENDYSKITYKLIQDITTKDRFLQKGIKWNGVDIDSFSLPAIEACPDKNIPMKNWLEFFGFWIADGTLRQSNGHHTVILTQNDTRENYVLSIIQNINFKTPSTRIKSIYQNKKGEINVCKDYYIESKQLFTYLSQFGKSYKKFIPRSFLELDTKYLNYLYYGYTYGDASYSMIRSKKYIRLSSVSKRLMDDMQELILKTFGVITQIHTEIKPTRKPLYRIDSLFTECSPTRPYDIPKQIPYNNFAYTLICEQNNIALTRRNGVIQWCHL